MAIYAIEILYPEDFLKDKRTLLSLFLGLSKKASSICSLKTLFDILVIYKFATTMIPISTLALRAFNPKSVLNTSNCFYQLKANTFSK
jgi:hypothetical protein